MKRLDRSTLILAGTVFLGAATYAQAPVTPPPAATPAPPLKNLKVFPADIPRDRLIAAMRGFTTSLGVKCSFCHAGEEGKLDFASDANPHKEVARKMLLMVRRINEQDFAVKDFSGSKVTCYTCHRGAAEPLTTAPPPLPAPAPPVAAPKAAERG